MSNLSSSTTEVLKMLATSAVTVLTSYQAITAHIDSTVAAEVRASTMELHYSVDRAIQHADSLHIVTMEHMSELRDAVSSQGKRPRKVMF